MGALYANARSTSEAVERLAVRRAGGEVVPVEGVDAERARAIAEFVKVLDRRAKDRARRAARRAAGALLSVSPDNPERRLVHETIYQALYVRDGVGYIASWPSCCVLVVHGASLIAYPMPGARRRVPSDPARSATRSSRRTSGAAGPGGAAVPTRFGRRPYRGQRPRPWSVAAEWRAR